jgi:hypothetical protein
VSKATAHVSPRVVVDITNPFSRFAEVDVGPGSVLKIGFEIVQGLCWLQWSFDGGFAKLLEKTWTEKQVDSLAFKRVVRRLCSPAERDFHTAKITDPASLLRRGQLAISEELAVKVLIHYGAARGVVSLLVDAVRVAVHANPPSPGPSMVSPRCFSTSETRSRRETSPRTPFESPPAVTSRTGAEWTGSGPLRSRLRPRRPRFDKSHPAVRGGLFDDVTPVQPPEDYERTARRRNNLGDLPMEEDHEEEEKQQEEEEEEECGGDLEQTTVFFEIAAARLLDGTWALDEKDILHVCQRFPKKGATSLTQTRQLMKGWPEGDPFYLANSTRWVLQDAALHVLATWCEPRRNALTVTALFNLDNKVVAVSPFGSSSMTPASLRAPSASRPAEGVTAISARLARLVSPGLAFDKRSPEVKKQ